MCLQDALEEMAWRLEDGVMQCSFRRNITFPGVKNRFDLNTSYYIFLASGAAEEGKYCVLIETVFSRYFSPLPPIFGETAVVAHF